MASDGKRTIHGGCHCGYITYTVDIHGAGDSIDLQAIRCNCTFCQKLGTTNIHMAGFSKSQDPLIDNFQLLTPASKEVDDKLGDYAPRVKTVHRYFCKICGVHVFMEGYWMAGEHRNDLLVVNAATIDQPQEGLDLSTTKIGYFDMLHANFAGGLKDTPWPNGLI